MPLYAVSVAMRGGTRLFSWDCNQSHANRDLPLPPPLLTASLLPAYRLSSLDLNQMLFDYSPKQLLLQ